MVRVGVAVRVKVGDGVCVMKIVGVRVGVKVKMGVSVLVAVGVMLGMLEGVLVGTGPVERKWKASTSLAVKPHVLPSKYSEAE